MKRKIDLSGRRVLALIAAARESRFNGRNVLILSPATLSLSRRDVIMTDVMQRGELGLFEQEAQVRLPREGHETFHEYKEDFEYRGRRRFVRIAHRGRVRRSERMSGVCKC